MQNELTVGSLFSGIGGIEIGFEKEGFKTKWFIENEHYAQGILKKRFPKTKIYGDITKIDFRTIPKVDILTGGFPCQDISDAGKRVGIEGSRSSHWKDYARAIRDIRPKFAFIENVSALALRGLNTVLSDLAKIGYDAEWYNLSASAVGAFHQRERIFIIAYPNRNRKPDESINGKSGQRIVGDVSDPNIGQCNRTEEEICPRGNPLNISSGNVPHSYDKGQERSRKDEVRHKELPHTKCFRSSEQRESRRFLHKKKGEDGEASRFNDDGIWRVEPELGRVADGISNRVDRIKCLGNAVVPQCAEVFARAIAMQLKSKENKE